MRSSWRTLLLAGVTAGLCLIANDANAGRFGGGGGGRSFGGYGGGNFNRGGYGGGYGGFDRGNFGGGGFDRGYGGGQFVRPEYRPSAPIQSGSVHGPYGGSFSGARQSGSFAGPGGGSGFGGREVGAYTGPRGAVDVGGARGGSYTTAGGATITGGSRGNVYTGPRGTTVIAGGKGGEITGPGGNTAGGAKGGAVVVGPNGNVHATGGKVGGVSTDSGTVVGGAHGAVTSGPGGTVAHGGRGAVAVGPNGAVAAGGRGVTGTGPGGSFAYGTRYVGATNLAGQGAYVRRGFGYYDAFRPGWYARYPGAWFAAGWVAGSAWAYPTWNSCCSYIGYADNAVPYTYNYGDNITYQDGNVYYGDQVSCTEQQYAEQASAIADAGAQAKPPADEKWQSLGVFAMVQGDETTSNDIFQLAINKDGIVRGNYYNAISDSTTPVTGSLDKKSQRVAWTIGDKKYPVYEAGLYNLTQEQTTMLVHMTKDETVQYRLFRIEQPKDGVK